MTETCAWSSNIVLRYWSPTCSSCACSNHTETPFTQFLSHSLPFGGEYHHDNQLRGKFQSKNTQEMSPSLHNAGPDWEKVHDLVPPTIYSSNDSSSDSEKCLGLEVFSALKPLSVCAFVLELTGEVGLHAPLMAYALGALDHVDTVRLQQLLVPAFTVFAEHVSATNAA